MKLIWRRCPPPTRPLLAHMGGRFLLNYDTIHLFFTKRAPRLLTVGGYWPTRCHYSEHIFARHFLHLDLLEVVPAPGEHTAEGPEHCSNYRSVSYEKCGRLWQTVRNQRVTESSEIANNAASAGVVSVWARMCAHIKSCRE